MRFGTILRILGLFLMMFSVSMLTPLIVDWFFEEAQAAPFYIAFCLTLVTGFLLWVCFRHHRKELRIADGFLLVVMFWFVLSAFASLPFILIVEAQLHPTDALFEAVSGLTTTGASVITHLEKIPYSLLYYRQQLNFLGGMGIIVLAISVFPILGVGGMQLYQAEVSGPIKEHKLTPRIAETARTLWFIYLGLNIACILSYRLAGMPLLEAIGEGFATVSTGGMSVHDGGFSYYDSPIIEFIAIVFMGLSTLNFGLHFLVLRYKTPKFYWRDEELRGYCLLIFMTIFLMLWGLYQYNLFPDFRQFVKVVFSAVSLLSTTGFVAQPISEWPSFIPVLLLLGALIGGCAGSTSGGIKVIRLLLLKKQVQRELHRLLHPQAVIRIKWGAEVLPHYATQAVWGFVAAFIWVLVMVILALMVTEGMDLLTSFGASAACLSNSGTGLGQVEQDFHILSATSKWILIFAMLAGRLEVFTLLILFTPMFWRG